MSLVPVLKDPKARPRKAALSQYADGYSIRTERYRYTEWGEQGVGGNELYDHSTDPVEMKNLANDPNRKAAVAELSALLRQRIAEARKPPKGLRQMVAEIKPRGKK